MISANIVSQTDRIVTLKLRSHVFYFFERISRILWIHGLSFFVQHLSRMTLQDDTDMEIKYEVVTTHLKMKKVYIRGVLAHTYTRELVSRYDDKHAPLLCHREKLNNCFNFKSYNQRKWTRQQSHSHQTYLPWSLTRSNNEYFKTHQKPVIFFFFLKKPLCDWWILTLSLNQWWRVCAAS